MFKHAAGAFILGVIATVAVVFLTASPQDASPLSAGLNLQMANRDKLELAPMDGVQEAAADVMGEESKTRGVVIAFNPARDKMLASVRIPKTDDWKKDWAALRDALPEDDVAAAIFSFPYWAGPASMTSKPVLFTSRPGGVDFKDEYLAGYWLGPLIIASEGVHSVKSFQGENYFEMCEKLEIDRDLCQLENQFHDCPFAGDDTEVNPCTQKGKDGVPVCGGSYIEADVAAGSISKDCCAAIDSYCSEDQERTGCRGDTLEMIVANCNAPVPEAEVTPAMEFFLTQSCDAVCAVKKCVEFENPADTYKSCSGCTGDFRESPCSPTQPGFVTFRCAGNADTCKGAANEVDCSIYGSDCMWATHDVAANFEAAPAAEESSEE